MVYKGPSRGCEACRKRRVKCDEGRPSCGICIKRKQQCPGYRNLFDAVHKDETRMTTDRAHQREPLNLSGTLPGPGELVRHVSEHSFRVQSPLKKDIEMEALCFFFAHYVNVPRDSQTNIYIEHILPVYINAASDSPLKLATSAAAIDIYQMWHMKGCNSEETRPAYFGAISALRSNLEDPNSAQSDEILCTIFMLDFKESLRRRFQYDLDQDTHQKGAMALIQQRGIKNFSHDSSKRLLAALRSRYITFALQSKRKVELDDDFLEERPNESLPGPKLDLIVADYANLQHDSRQLIEFEPVPLAPESPMSPELIEAAMSYDDILRRAIDVESKLLKWQQELPSSWAPFRIHDTSTIHLSIHNAGLYNNLCDVYSSIGACHTLNICRSINVATLRLVKHCLQHLDDNSPYRYLINEADIDNKIQNLVDNICAAVPFHLGSRNSISMPYDPQDFPPIPATVRAQANFCDSLGQPTKMTDRDHARAAASIGGWFVLTPLSVIFRMAGREGERTPFDSPETASSNRIARIKLRPGQREWIFSQIKRIHKLYMIPPPPKNMYGIVTGR